MYSCMKSRKTLVHPNVKNKSPPTARVGQAAKNVYARRSPHVKVQQHLHRDKRREVAEHVGRQPRDVVLAEDSARASSVSGVRREHATPSYGR